MFWIVLWVLSVIAAGVLAERKGRSGGGWGAAAIVFGPLAVLVVLLLGPSEASTRVCPNCAELVARAALACKHCGRDLPPVTAVAVADTVDPSSGLRPGEG
jgi:hypothetical protein